MGVRHLRSLRRALIVFDPARGYPAVVPFVRYADAEAGVRWLERILGAREALRHVMADGRLGHSELVVGDAVIQVGHMEAASSSMTLVFVDDVDAAVARALDAGGELTHAPVERPWGLRQATVADPEGHLWELSAHVRDVPPAEWGAEMLGPLPG